MHILALEEYGLRCLLRVALLGTGRPVSAQEISREEGIGPEYVARIMGALRAGGLIESTRGAGGGYRLARPANEINVWEVVTVLGGEFFAKEFCGSHPGQRRECVRTTDCSIRALWQKTQSVLQETLEHISLEDLQRDEPAMLNWLDAVAPSHPS